MRATLIWIMCAAFGAAFYNKSAKGCSPYCETRVFSTVPPHGYGEMSVDGVVVVRFGSSCERSDSPDPSFGSLYGEAEEAIGALYLGQDSIEGALEVEEGQLRFVPDAPLLPGQEYRLRFELRSGYYDPSNEESFLAGELAFETSPVGRPASPPFSGLRDLWLTEEASPAMSCCPLDIGQCPGTVPCVQSGWSYSQIMGVRFDAVDTPSGPTAMEYALVEVLEGSEREIRRWTIDQVGSATRMVKPRIGAEPRCFRVVAYDANGERVETQPVQCISNAQLEPIARLPDPEPESLVCDGEPQEPMMPMEPQMPQDPVDGGLSLDTAQGCGCSAAGPGRGKGLSALLIWGLIGLCLGLRRSVYRR